MKRVVLVLILGLVLISGWVVYNYFIPYGGVIYRLAYSYFLQCPEGYERFYGLMGAYCATDSQKPCSSFIDCPENERCISEDGKNWFCSGRITGCYFWDPENPEQKICID
jgi:hypothetical protein